MPKPSDFLAVRIVVHPVWSQELDGCRGACVHERETETRNGGELVTKLQHENCFGICVTAILIRQNSSERLSASLVLASATFSSPGTFEHSEGRLAAVLQR